jgi:hypothetical protein
VLNNLSPGGHSNSCKHWHGKRYPIRKPVQNGAYSKHLEKETRNLIFSHPKGVPSTFKNNEKIFLQISAFFVLHTTENNQIMLNNNI